MISNQIRTELPPFFDQNEDLSAVFFELGAIEEFNEGDYLNKQFFYSEYFYLLLEGSVVFSLQLEDSKQEFEVGDSSERWTPIGWSGFRYPSRYATTVKCKEKCLLYKWKHEDLSVFMQENEAFGAHLLNFISEQGFYLLEHVRNQLMLNTKQNWSPLGRISENQNKAHSLDVITVLQRSSFFENFSGDYLRVLATLVKRENFRSGEYVTKQGDEINRFYFLGAGKVGWEYSFDNQVPIPIKLISRMGLIVSWVAVTGTLKSDVSTVALNDSVLYYIDVNELNALFDANPSLAFEFSKRILWLISNQLRSARSKLISLRFEQELVAVRNLLQQNATQLSVQSDLHKIPHLLEHTYTLADAFKILENANNFGNPLEVSLAQTITDILADIHHEYLFYEGLTKVYDSVVTAPKEMDALSIRKLCAQKFVDLYENVPVIVSGMENLPEKGNHIFILNHLKNHPYNTLPNNFQLTLDSHFVSSMILYKTYNDPGIRVVRVSTGAEYGHQNYYDRLGHIYVYTNESEKVEMTKEEKKMVRENFYKEAAGFLEQGMGLILSPEGTSVETHESPVAFKAGAFNLALNIDPEPYIVPIAVANFDKRMTHNCLSVVIKKPFLMSEQIKDKNNKEELFSWLKSYRLTYRSYVEEAIEQSKTYRKTSF